MQQCREEQVSKENKINQNAHKLCIFSSSSKKWEEEGVGVVDDDVDVLGFGADTYEPRVLAEGVRKWSKDAAPGAAKFAESGGGNIRNMWDG